MVPGYLVIWLRLSGSRSTSTGRSQVLQIHPSPPKLAEWWKETGKTRFPMIYPVAMCILSLPDSNGHQERTFSAATWMDGKLNSMQKDLTFQMKVLMYKNANFLERYGNAMEAELLDDAEKRTRDLLVKHISSKNEEEIEYDTERIMNLYGIYGEDE
jgi:hypothetical protein